MFVTSVCNESFKSHNFESCFTAFCLLVFVFWQVGSDFGYFPKDLLEINHNYSNEELELPTDVSLICYFLIGLL